MDFNKYKPTIERVSLDDGDHAFVRSLNAREFLNIRSIAKSNDEETGFQIVLKSLSNEDGSPATTNIADVEGLPLNIFNQVLAAALHVNGLNTEAFDDLKKKQTTTPNDS